MPQSVRRPPIKLFITGAGSFIGRELLRHCDRANIEAVGVDVQAIDRRDCIVADVRDRRIGSRIPEGVDAIIHLAALSRDEDCRDRGYRCFDTNVMSTLNLMDAAADRGAKQFIFASSEWIYEGFENGVWKTEESPIDISRHTSEYALSKLVSEANLTQKYQHGFCSVTILRFGIVYGPRAGDWSAVESLLNTVATTDEVSVDSKSTGRCFIHVSDIADAILASVGTPGFEIFNIQGERLITLGDIIDVGMRLTGRQPRVVERAPERSNVRLVSGEKAKAMLGWEPGVGLEEGARSVIEYLGLRRSVHESADVADR